MPDAEKDVRMPILTGYASRRAAGVRMELQRRAETAYAASLDAEDERGAAALRGKAHGLREAVDLIRALENGGRIGRRRRSLSRATPPEGATCPHRVPVGEWCAGCDMYDEPATANTYVLPPGGGA